MWTYRLHNSTGLSVQADLYFEGKFTGISSQMRCDPAYVRGDAQAVVDALNMAAFHGIAPISLILVGNEAISVYFRDLAVFSLYYGPKTPEKHEK